MLQEAARRIRAVVRASDTVARLGGDEFAILLATQDRGKAADIAGQIGEQVRQPMVLADGTPAEVGVSIGIALAPEHGADGRGSCIWPIRPCTRPRWPARDSRSRRPARPRRAA